MSDQNWRTDVDAGDYFLHQKKQLQVADRRPVIRRGSDLVGPGIGANTVRLDDFNDLLATFNGYFSATADAANAPTATEAFIGQVLSDAELGGRQTFTGLTSGIEYTRTFSRSPVDAEAVAWSPWVGANRLTQAAQGYLVRYTNTLSGAPTTLRAPDISILGPAGAFQRVEEGIKITRQGVYTGVIQVGSTASGVTLSNLTVYRPEGPTTTGIAQTSVPLNQTASVPFTVWATDGAQGFNVVALHSAGVPVDLWWRFSCARIGDAV